MPLFLKVLSVARSAVGVMSGKRKKIQLPNHSTTGILPAAEKSRVQMPDTFNQTHETTLAAALQT